MTAVVRTPAGSVVLTLAAGGRPPALLLLHGLANSSTVWRAFLDRQRTGHETWAADLPWRADGDPSWYRQSDPLDRIADAVVGVPRETTVLLAHSLTANLVLAWLDRELARGVDPFGDHGIHGLVLVAPFFRHDPEAFSWATISYYLNDFHLLLEEGIRVHSGGRLATDIQLDMALRLRDRVGPYGWMRFFQTYLATPWLRTELFTVPCLVLAGDQDTTAPPRESQALVERLPRAWLHVLPDCGHFPMTEQAARFAVAVDEFVQRLR